MLRKIGSFAFLVGTADAPQRIPLLNLPQKGPGGFAYLKRLLFHTNFTSIVTGAGGAVTPIDLHDTIFKINLSAAGTYWGPKGVSGHDLAAIHAAHSSEPLFYVEDEGDANVPASTTTIRQVVDVYDFGLLGAKDSDFSPPVAYLAANGGVLEFSINSAPTNATTYTGTTDVYAETIESPELRAVPQVMSERQGVSALTNGQISGGRLISMLLKKSSDIADGDVTGISLEADGQTIMGDSEVKIHLPHYPSNSNAATNKQYESGFAGEDLATTARSRFLPVWPSTPHYRQKKVSRKPYGNAFTYTVRGAITAAATTWITTTAKRISPALAVDQYAGGGANRAVLEEIIGKSPADVAFRPKTETKVGGVRPEISGWIPVKLASPELARHVNL